MGLQNLFTTMDSRRGEYEAAIALGASARFATQSFVSDAIRKSLAPTLASMTTTGLVTLPGMMTGQILEEGKPDYSDQISALDHDRYICHVVDIPESHSDTHHSQLHQQRRRILVNFKNQ